MEMGPEPDRMRSLPVYFQFNYRICNLGNLASDCNYIETSMGVKGVKITMNEGKLRTKDNLALFRC